MAQVKNILVQFPAPISYLTTICRNAYATGVHGYMYTKYM